MKKIFRFFQKYRNEVIVGIIVFLFYLLLDIMRPAKNSGKYFIVLEYGSDTVQTISKAGYDSLLIYDVSEIVRHPTRHPDSLYFMQAYNTFRFGSEQGRDLYHLVYAKYISESINKKVTEKTVKELEEMFHSINVFAHKVLGSGSWFYHMYNRIPAYTQYRLIGYDQQEHTKKPDPMKKQYFLRLLTKQIIQTNPPANEWIMADFDKMIDTEFTLNEANAFMELYYGTLLK